MLLGRISPPKLPLAVDFAAGAVIGRLYIFKAASELDLAKKRFALPGLVAASIRPQLDEGRSGPGLETILDSK